MKHILLAMALLCCTLAACAAHNEEMKPIKIEVTVNGKSFAATLENNNATQDLVKHLPLALTMSELNGNEKYNYLDFTMPTSSFTPGTIHAGDLLLWGNDCLVLFYETFSSPYSYTRLGKLDDATGLAGVVGSGNVTVTFKLQDPTGVSDVSSDEAQPQVIYDLQGVKQNQPLAALPAGVYIVNGKKIAKK